MQTIFGIVGRDSVMQRLLLQPGCDDYLPIREVGRAGGKTCTRTCRVGIFSSRILQLSALNHPVKSVGRTLN